MSEKEKGLYKKFEVKKISNPTKELDCIVLEFDDHLAREGIFAFAKSAKRGGFHELHDDLMEKLSVWENEP